MKNLIILDRTLLNILQIVTIYFILFFFVLHIRVIPQNEDIFILQDKLNFLSQNIFLVAV